MRGRSRAGAAAHNRGQFFSVIHRYGCRGELPDWLPKFPAVDNPNCPQSWTAAKGNLCAGQRGAAPSKNETVQERQLR
jgi:hypothetical protein